MVPLFVKAALFVKLFPAVMVPKLLFVEVPPFEVRVPHITEPVFASEPPLMFRLFDPRANVPLLVRLPLLLEKEAEKFIVPELVNSPALFEVLPFTLKSPVIGKNSIGRAYR